MITKWLLLGLICFLLVIMTSLSHRRERKYYQRLASHATNADTAALDYSVRLLSQSARNYLLFSVSFIVLVFCVVFYDVKQSHRHQINSLRLDVSHCQSEKVKQDQATSDMTVNDIAASADVQPPPCIRQYNACPLPRTTNLCG